MSSTKTKFLLEGFSFLFTHETDLMIVEHTFHRTWCGHSISAKIAFCLMAVVRFFGLSHECMTNTKEFHFPSLSERIHIHYLGDCVVKVSGFSQTSVCISPICSRTEFMVRIDPCQIWI